MLIHSCSCYKRIEITCKAEENYNCIPDQEVNISDENCSVVFKNYQNKKSLIIIGHTVNYIPKGTQRYYQNLIQLTINDSKLKSIKQNNLKVFEKLMTIFLEGNEIENLEENLFQFNTKLLYIYLNRNHIVDIHPSLLNQIPNIIIFELIDNKCYSGSTKQMDLKHLKKYIKYHCWDCWYDNGFKDGHIELEEDEIKNSELILLYLSTKYLILSIFVILVILSTVSSCVILCDDICKSNKSRDSGLRNNESYGYNLDNNVPKPAELLQEGIEKIPQPIPIEHVYTEVKE